VGSVMNGSEDAAFCGSRRANDCDFRRVVGVHRLGNLQARPDSPAFARALVRAALADHSDEFIHRAELITSELVTNAVIHAEPPIELRIAVDSGRVTVAVLDSSEGQPVVRHPGERASHHGRGLLIVDDLADVWGVDKTDKGKTVWFTARI
jgi:anti-sigma regulatory factor (Ser/Thr protein kinase)